MRDGVPDPEARDDERDLFLAGRRGKCEHGEREQAFFVEVPESEQQEGRRERDGMKLVQGEPARCWVEQVGEGEAERSPR